MHVNCATCIHLKIHAALKYIGHFSTYNVIETEMTHCQPMFHLLANQVVGFYQHNV